MAGCASRARAGRLLERERLLGLRRDRRRSHQSDHQPEDYDSSHVLRLSLPAPVAETRIVGVPEATLDALHDVGEMLFDDLVVDAASLAARFRRSPHRRMSIRCSDAT